MKNMLILTTAALALTACNKEAGATGELPVADTPVEAVAAPDGQEWADVVSKTDAGGYLMGNPDAPVKVVEYGSMTCGACAFFSTNGEQQLKEEYLDSGRVSFEFRNYTRDPIDVTASLLARCGGENRFFPLTDAMFAAQNEWYGQRIPQLREVMPQLRSLSPNEQFARLAEVTGLKTFAVQRGLPASQADACLADEAAVSELVSMQSVGQSDFGVNRTPYFLINGVPAQEVDADYSNLKPVLQRALGEEVTAEAAAE
ncbi:thioredoxin domain-containing protein [Sphingomicrobium sp. XHP0239]|uniref:thioredoxin domain-containing protein n=1 Tax=Sphingomicrobium maritimum TaxID=3133972 RepID=UPI0031CC8116